VLGALSMGHPQRFKGSNLWDEWAKYQLLKYSALPPVCACSHVSSLLLNRATMSQQSSLTQLAHSVRQVLTAYKLPNFWQVTRQRMATGR